MRQMVKNLVAAGALILLGASPNATAQSAAPEFDAKRLNAQLLVAHPGLVTSDSPLMREDILTALENDPGAPLAAVAARLLWDLETDGEWSPSLAAEPERLLRLAARVEDAQASLLLRQIVRRHAARRRFSAEPLALPGDLYGEFVATWRVVGPLGPLDLSAPSLAPAPKSSPEPLADDGPLTVDGPQAADSSSRIAEAYVTSTGEERRWQRLQRPRNTLDIDPVRFVYPTGGLAYALAFIAVPEAVAVSDSAAGGSAVLELRASGPVLAWWNGAPVVREPRTTSFAVRDRFLVRVPVHPGWNALLVRISVNDSTRIAARVLDAEGRVLAIEEPGTDEPLLVDWTVGGATELLPAPLLDSPMLGDDGDPFSPALRALCAWLAGRPDVALTFPPPSDPAGLAAWRLMHLRALTRARHLTKEIRRRRQIELVDTLERDGPFFAEARANRISRLLREDRPIEALVAVDEWIDSAPERAWPRFTRTFALDAIDRYGLLGQLHLEALVADYPSHMAARMRLAKIAQRNGDAVGSVGIVWDLLTSTTTLGSGADDDVFDMVLDSLERVDSDSIAMLLGRARAWSAQVPGNTKDQVLVKHILIALGRDAERLARAEATAAAHPDLPLSWWDLGNIRLRVDDTEGALQALRRELVLDPADETTRMLVATLGDQDPAEQFFAHFAPDGEAALATAEGGEDASVVEALDSGLVYYFPDGSFHARYRTLSIARDRTGADALHSMPVSDDTQQIRVLAQDGRVLEPVDVGGEWVMPSLEPGDVVEIVWDMRGTGIPGAPPAMRRWNFASFERAFPTTRWVVHVPRQLDARFVLLNYDGSHDEIPWEDGVVHVFEDSNARLIAEPWQPSNGEIIPAADFGQDLDRADELRDWSAHALAMSALPADLEVELEAFIREHAPVSDGRSNRELLAAAGALYAALEQRTQDYAGGRAAATVWQERRGWPMFLLAALYERAGIPFEWAVLENAISPELDPDPVQPFAGTRPLEREALRLTLRDKHGDPVWVLHSGQPGTPFGALSSSIVGAQVHVIEADGGSRRETLPRTQQDASWNAEITLSFTLDEAGNAAVTGQFVDSTPEGRMNARRLREATAEQRDGLARGQAASMAPGVDVTSAHLILDGSKGEGLVLRFAGTFPSFVSESGGGYSAHVPFLPLQLATRFGPAERRWPLAMRQAYRLQVSIVLDTGRHWKIVDSPLPIAEIREGFEAELAVSRPNGTIRVYTQRLEQRGLLLAADEVPQFLKKLGALEREFSRPLRLERVR